MKDLSSFKKNLSLNGKKIIITGCNSGIGLSLIKKTFSSNKILAFVNEKKTFDINIYETEDLLGILDLNGSAPINENKIDEKIQTLKYRLRNNKKKIQIFKFLDHAAIKLKKQFETFNKKTWQEAYEHDESAATEVLKNQYQNKKGLVYKRLITRSPLQNDFCT